MEWLVKPKKLRLVKPKPKMNLSESSEGNTPEDDSDSSEDVYGYETLCALGCPTFCSCENLVE